MKSDDCHGKIKYDGNANNISKLWGREGIPPLFEHPRVNHSNTAQRIAVFTNRWGLMLRSTVVLYQFFF